MSAADRLIASGNIAPFQTGPEIEERLRDGTSSVYTWQGTRAEADVVRSYCRSRGAATISTRPNGNGDWIVTATFSGTPDEEGGQQSDPPVSTHELDVSIEQVPVYCSRTLNTRFGSLNKEFLGAVKYFVERYQAGEFTPTESETTTTALQKARAALLSDLSKLASLDDYDASYAEKAELLFYAIVARGMDSCLEYNSVYRRTITSASASQVQAAYTGVGEIWTSSEVEEFEGIPTAEWFGLDPTMQWLKSPPNVSAVSGGKTQITYYYTARLKWSALLYDSYNSATLIDVGALP